MRQVILSITGLVTASLTAGCSVFGISTVEEASYELILAEDNFELRLYQPLVVAETTVEADFDEAGGLAFEKLFGYISGENTASSKIAMTAPVLADQSRSNPGRKIDMTVPVLEERTDEGWRYMFVLPAYYTLGSAPAPLHPDVKLSPMPEQKVAVIRYSGTSEKKVIDNKTLQLNEWISANNLTPASKPRWAGYNPPWTLPFLRRNEVLIDVN
ncbi:MAG: heme-binding protein [Gammaproteobacteria bacterium]|jgi:hypothetical protein